MIFDTGWAGTFPQFCRALGEAGATVEEIRYLFISHFSSGPHGKRTGDCRMRCKNRGVRCATGADKVFVEDVARMYLTHQNISVQGILDRIEIKGK